MISRPGLTALAGVAIGIALFVILGPYRFFRQINLIKQYSRFTRTIQISASIGSLAEICLR